MIAAACYVIVESINHRVTTTSAMTFERGKKKGKKGGK